MEDTQGVSGRRAARAVATTRAGRPFPQDCPLGFNACILSLRLSAISTVPAAVLIAHRAAQTS